jgi:hypothetical protein
MYNIHSHYENIWHYLNTIVTHPRLLYLHPYGTTQPENIETLTTDNLPDGPLFIFYDQEPIYPEFNQQLFDYIQNNMLGPFILITTEKNSDAVNAIQDRYGWPTVYYFHHIFASHDWYRGYAYDCHLQVPADRNLSHKYISFNRLTSNRRVYRSLLIAELQRQKILDQGKVSYNHVCPEGGSYQQNLIEAVKLKLLPATVAADAIKQLDSIKFPLRIDYTDHEFIPNHSFVLSAVQETQKSFCYLVTETCYWERKDHLTEKIFKPVVSQMPFVLVGPAHNLKYLRSYGFKTFSPWIDESYDDIEDPVLRMQAIGDTMRQICSRSMDELTAMLLEMIPVLEHNYRLFYSNDFLNSAWSELTDNLLKAISTLEASP